MTLSAAFVRSPLAILVVGTLLAGLLPSSAAEAQFWKRQKTYQDGDTVAITGRVTDSTGQPIPGIHVQLEASRKSFSFKKMRKQEQNPVVISARTSSDGEYRLEWQWHRYYNHFELRAVVLVPGPEGSSTTELLARTDLSDRVAQGSPVIAPMTVGDTRFVRALRQFEAGIDTEDERRVYRENGKPGKVQSFEYPGRFEESWWYFDLGAVYWFHDGELAEIENFDPVASAESERLQPRRQRPDGDGSLP